MIPIVFYQSITPLEKLLQICVILSIYCNTFQFTLRRYYNSISVAQYRTTFQVLITLSIAIHSPFRNNCLDV